MTLSGSRGTGSGTHWKIFSTTAAIPELRKGFRDGCGISRRGRNRRVRAPARYVVPDQWDFRVRSEGAWPRLGLDVAPAESLRPRRPTRRPLVARRSLSIHRLAREAAVFELTKKQLMTPVGKATPKVKSSPQTTTICKNRFVPQ